MNIRTHRRYKTALLAFLTGISLPAIANAQSPQAAEAGAWQYAATLYLYLPSLGGSTAFPVVTGGSDISVDPGKLVDSLESAFMGSFNAHNGRWGMFTDVVYLDLSGTKSNSRDFTIGGGVPAGTTANLDWNLKGVAWTLAGEYRVSSDANFTMDVLAGARYFDLDTTLGWGISGSLGSLPPASTSGTSKVGISVWDGVVGVKGRYVLGAERKWSVPFYLDVGTGQSDLTWQAAGGISYAFQWGEVNALWRYVGYELESGSYIKDINFNGPMVGATFRW